MLEGLKKMKHVAIGNYKHFHLTLSRDAGGRNLKHETGEVGRGGSWRALGTLSF